MIGESGQAIPHGLVEKQLVCMDEVAICRRKFFDQDFSFCLLSFAGSDVGDGFDDVDLTGGAFNLRPLDQRDIRRSVAGPRSP